MKVSNKRYSSFINWHLCFSFRKPSLFMLFPTTQLYEKKCLVKLPYLVISLFSRVLSRKFPFWFKRYLISFSSISPSDIFLTDILIYFVHICSIFLFQISDKKQVIEAVDPPDVFTFKWKSIKSYLKLMLKRPTINSLRNLSAKLIPIACKILYSP